MKVTIGKIVGALCVFVLLATAPHRPVYADEVINISTPEQLEAIGKSEQYPLDGDYVLTCDIDMADAKHTPIGTVAKPFTGTFDGAGYTIKNVNLQGVELGTIPESECENLMGYGIFGVVKNNSDSDVALIRNLTISKACVKATPTVDCAAGILAAVLYNGVTIENIAIVNTSLELNSAYGSVLYGAGNLVGMVWTAEGTGIKTKTQISDIYTDGRIAITDFVGENTVSGVVGCVYNVSMASMTAVVSLGDISYDDSDGYALATCKKYDANGIVDEVARAYYALEDDRQDNGIGSGIAKGVLASGKVALTDRWSQSQGILPLLTDGTDEQTLQARIYPILKRHQTINNITEDFYVPVVYDKDTTDEADDSMKITWESSSSSIVIDESTGLATVTVIDGKAEKVTLTYTCGDVTGSIDVTVGEEKEMCLNTHYVKPGEILKVMYAPTGATFKWKKLDKETNETIQWPDVTGEYVVTEEDLESFISVTVNGTDTFTIYVSTLPVVYIDTNIPFNGVSKKNYSNADIKICGDSDKYPSWDLYEGAMEFKGRGHSSSYYEKIGLKLKLSKKSDVYGVSGNENKHWVLVSNVLDSSLMRNSIMNQFFDAIGANEVMRYEDVILVYNGDYKGVYQISEHVRIDECRVEVFDFEEYAKDVAKTIASATVKKGELAAHFEDEYADELQSIMEADYGYIDKGYVEDSQGKRLMLGDYGFEKINATGGYLVVMDRYSKVNSYKQATLHTAYTLPLYIDKPDTDEQSQLTSFRELELYDYAVKFNQSFEYALHSDDFFFDNDDTHYKVVGEGSNESGQWTGTVYEKTTYTDDAHDGLHYTEMFDIDSLVQNFLVCEFSQNYDSMKNSFYYKKDIDELAIVSPFWDYDWALGNWITTRYTNMPTKWQTTLNGATEVFYQHVSWNRMLIRDPYFLMKVWEKYKSMRDTGIEDIVKDGGFIDTQYERLQKVAVANDTKWAHLDVFRGFEPAYDDLTQFVDKRVAWLDEQFESVDTLISSLGYYHVSNLLEVKAVTLNEDGSAHIEATISEGSGVGSIAFQVNGAYLVSAKVENGVASVDIPADVLVTTSNNMVEVKAMDESGNYMVNSKYSEPGNYNLIHSNYYIFTMEKDK